MTRLLPMLVVAVLAMLAAADVSADIPEEEWNKTFGGLNDDEGRLVQQTSDGGYILAGYTRSFGAGGHDVWLLKTDDTGDEQWNKAFGGSYDDKAYSVQQTTDGGFVVVGQTNSYGAGSLDVYLIKTDYSGDKQWSRTLGGLEHDVGYSVKQTSDGGYIITGYTASYGAGVRDVWLIKTDASGNEQWNETFGSIDYDYECGWSVQQTSDGGFIIAAHVYHTHDYLIKTDANGNEQWNKTLDGFGASDTPYSVQQTSDGGFIVAGATWCDGANYVYLMKIDANGDEAWNKTFGRSRAYSVQQTSDEGFIVAGNTCTPDVYLIKTDASGNEEWSKTFGGSNWDIGYSVQQTSDGGYIIAGYTKSYGAYRKDVWLIKVGAGEEPNPPASSTFGAPGSNSNVPFSYEPVNLATGSYFYQYQDLFIPGRGLPLTIVRSYNSMDTYSGPFGSGWTFNYNMNLIETGSGDIVVIREDGRRDTYTQNADGRYTPPLNVYDTLAKNPDDTYILAMKDQRKYNFTAQGKLNNIIDKNGNQINLEYTGGYLSKVTDASGKELIFTYDVAGRIIAITGPVGRTWSYTYDDESNLIWYTNPMGGQFSYTYDENHWMTSITDPRGNQIMTNTYDGEGRVISQSNALVAIYTFSYDAENRETTETDPFGGTKIYAYDEHFWGLSETDQLGNIIYYAYDENGNRISVTNANGQATQFAYDTNGNIIQITDPMGYPTSMTYDSKDKLISVTDALGRQISLEYDANTNLVRAINALGDDTHFTYDEHGQLISGTDANGHTANFAYDNNGNQIAVTDALGTTVAFTYDSVCRLITTTDANGNTYTLLYDDLDRLVSVTDPFGYTASNTYDAVGNRIGFTDPAGSLTSYSYDPLNQLADVTDAMGGTVHYNYDIIGNMISMTDANGHTTNYAYDPLNRPVSTIDPLGYTTSNVYDAVGNTVSLTDANGKTTSYSYDDLNRLIEIAYPDDQTVGYSYDAMGNRLMMVDGHGTTNYEYDELNRLLSVLNPDTQTVGYMYDAVGNRVQITYPDDKMTSYAYDANNRLIGVTDWDTHITSYAHDTNGNLIGMTYPNGMEAEYVYDEGNRLIELINKNGTHVVSSFEYSMDAVGNRLRVNETFLGRFECDDLELEEALPLTTTYEYDTLYRLTKVDYPFDETVSYNCDSMGNRISMTTTIDGIDSTVDYTYDAADRLLQSGSITFAYDNNGNLIEKSGNPGRIMSYGYDGANRLIGISTLFGSQTDLYNFEYDGDGNRISKTIMHGKSTQSIDYVWDVNSILPQVLTESNKKGTTYHTYGLDLISKTDPHRGEFYYHHDGLGSVRSLSDSKERIKTIYLYDAFGQLRKEMGHVDNDFLFTGEQMDDETGLIYLRARYYDPAVCRFVNRDPSPAIGTMTQSINRYVYTMNNPVNLIDPSGYCSEMVNSKKIKKNPSAMIIPTASEPSVSKSIDLPTVVTTRTNEYGNTEYLIEEPSGESEVYIVINDNTGKSTALSWDPGPAPWNTNPILRYYLWGLTPLTARERWSINE